MTRKRSVVRIHYRPPTKDLQIVEKRRASALLPRLFDTNRGLRQRILHSAGGVCAHARYDVRVTV